MKHKIRINCGIKENDKENYYLKPIYTALKLIENKYDFIIEETDEIDFLNIEVNGKTIGLISYGDGFAFSSKDLKRMSIADYKFIIKYHYNPNQHDYSVYDNYSNKIIPFGLWRYSSTNFDKDYLLNKERPIDVTAQFRSSNSGGSSFPWSRARVELRTQCENMKSDGYNTVTKMIPHVNWMESLENIKLAFVWSASAYLGWKIPEFTEKGVIMITEPLGKNNPLVNDTTFEDGFNCIFCDNPKEFSNVAKQLLEDKDKLYFLRKNVIETWENKMHPLKVAEYLYKVITKDY
jgi:hypothetical protein